MMIANGFSKGRYAYSHDIRKGELPNNIDSRLTPNNVVLIDEIQGRTLEQYTNDIMQPFIDAYNVGKKPSRRINTTYTEWHKNDKVMTQNINPEDVEFAHEYVLCYGNHEDYWHEYFDDNTTPERKQQMHDEAVEVYTKMIEEFKKRYPHMHIALAVIHADEPHGSVHCHTIIQSRANEYQRGLKTRISLSRALEQDGFEHIQQTSKAKEMGGFQLERLIRDFRHNVMNPMMEERGFTIKEEEHGRDHIENGAYQQIMQKVDKEKKKVQELKSMQQTLDEIDEIKTAPIFDESQVKKVQIKDGLFGKSETVVQMPLDTYEGLVAEAKNKSTIQTCERKIEACIKVFQEHKDKTADINKFYDDIYKDKITKLENEIKEKNSIIRELQGKVKQLEEFLTRAKQFLEEHNFVKMYEQWKERLMIKKEQSKVHFTTIIDDREQEHTQTRK